MAIAPKTAAGGAVAATLYTSTFSKPAPRGAVPEEWEAKEHHIKDGIGFVNPWESWREMSVLQVSGTLLWRKFTGRLPFPDTSPPTVLVRKPVFLPSRHQSQGLRATWLGHACYYVEFPSGLRVLFDPVFEERCSPFSWLGPKRYTRQPVEVEEIPHIDVVIISHSHYDHLSHPTVLKIQQHHPNALFAVPLGIKKWLNQSGIHNAVELDWWDDIDVVLSPTETGKKRISVTSSQLTSASTTTLPPPTSPTSPSASPIMARISSLPCQHTSERSSFDKNHTLWSSWAVSSGGKSVWFGGDTGYRAVPELPKSVDAYGSEYAHLPRCPAFKQIGDLRGPFDLGLIPIGAYDPRFIMSSLHANPFDSVEIFKDTRCKWAMGIHWGTWALTMEEVLEPPVLLKQALKRSGIAETGVFDVCDIGESREF